MLWVKGEYTFILFELFRLYNILKGSNVRSELGEKSDVGLMLDCVPDSELQ